ncbi:amidohydrolase family protein [[Clostridium] sordellii ATCC 9714]|nr:amidohydrolase family protein [[Clostridium] sordellii ATCC 9714] [Paeniclostridium sordellii ATCC 9714]
MCAVNRVTKNGVLLGEAERISTLEALKAVTINSAYQYFEEDIKGSIKEGKLADLVILDKNPLKVNKMEIRNIKILETIKEGNTIFRA